MRREVFLVRVMDAMEGVRWQQEAPAETQTNAWGQSSDRYIAPVDWPIQLKLIRFLSQRQWPLEPIVAKFFYSTFHFHI